MRVLRVRSVSFLLFVLCTEVHAQGQGELLVLPDVRDGFFCTRNGSRTCPCSDGVCTREDHAWRPVTVGGLAGVMDVMLCSPSVLAATTADIFSLT